VRRLFEEVEGGAFSSKYSTCCLGFDSKHCIETVAPSHFSLDLLKAVLFKKLLVLQPRPLSSFTAYHQHNKIVSKIEERSWLVIVKKQFTN